MRTLTVLFVGVVLTTAALAAQVSTNEPLGAVYVHVGKGLNKNFVHSAGDLSGLDRKKLQRDVEEQLRNAGARVVHHSVPDGSGLLDITVVVDQANEDDGSLLFYLISMEFSHKMQVADDLHLHVVGEWSSQRSGYIGADRNYGGLPEGVIGNSVRSMLSSFLQTHRPSK